MEFWGLEVKPGTTLKCVPEDDYILHLSQAALGESKKASGIAIMYVKVDDQKLAIGTLSTDKCPQIQFDLVFEKAFELSHTSKAASVFFSGYKVLQPVEGDEMDVSSEEDEDEEKEEMNNLVIKENGKAQDKEESKGGKAGAATSKANAVALDVDKKRNSDDSDETDDSDDDDDLSSEEGDDDGSSDEDDSSEDDDESDEDEEETPKKPEAGKKRVAENALKAPASDKKAKVATPSGQKTGGKNTHVATPHPAKQASKTPANNDKAKSPKSGGLISCSSCSKTFNSEKAMQDHAKAKKH
jgi:hypothetical protein